MVVFLLGANANQCRGNLGMEVDVRIDLSNMTFPRNMHIVHYISW